MRGRKHISQEFDVALFCPDPRRGIFEVVSAESSRRMKLLIAISAGFAALAASSIAAAKSPVVVELFTSQSCSSCVAATAYSAELAEHDGVILLAWHVDYWNSLQTRNGRWVDPYSDPAHTERQRQYNRNLRSTGSVYTPQIVVNGASEAVGSARDAVDGLISQARAKPAAARIQSIKLGADGNAAVYVSGEGDLVAVYFKPMANTAVNGGENAGLRFTERNIVTDFEVLGPIDGDGAFSVLAPAPGQKCAVLVQAPEQGAILTAAHCPVRN